jgi:hypothetical protein
MRTFIKKKKQLKIFLMTLLFICLWTIPAFAQAQIKKQSDLIFTVIFLVAVAIFGILAIVITIRKNKERKREYQPIISEIFKKRGFSAVDLIVPYCQCIYRNNGQETVVNNIVLGVKGEMLSFFGGGSEMVSFETKEEKLSFGTVVFWKKILKEEQDIVLSDGYIAKLLFPKKDKYKFKHLFDIQISDIEIIEAKQREKKIELNIECLHDDIKLIPRSQNVETRIVIANTIIGAFDRMIKNGSLSKREISKLNRETQEILIEDANISGKKFWKGMGAAILITGTIVGAAAVSGARRHSRDMTLSQIS